MSLVSGDFTETTLQNIRVRSSELLMDEMTKLQYTPSSLEVFNAVNAVQTAQINPLFANHAKDNKIELIDLHSCELETTAITDCFDSQDFNENSTAKKELELTQTKETKFKIDENNLRDNTFTFEEAMAKSMLAGESRLIEDIQSYMVSVLNAGKGVNAYTGGIGTVSGSDTNIPSANWTSAVFPYLMTVMKKNRFKNGAFLTDNDEFYQAMVTAQLNAGNANGAGDLASFNALKTFFDMQIMADVNTPDSVSYLLGLGSVAFASKPMYTTELEVNQDHVRWSYQSSIVPGLWISMLMERDCSENYVVQKVKMMTKYDLFTNPTGCDSDRTGILTFVKTAS